MNTNNTNIINLFSEDQKEVFQSYLNNENIFITGPGGCGKSFLIKHIYNHAIDKEKKIQVTALTGCAAILLQCNAKTIHSWSGVKVIGNYDINNIITFVMTNKFYRKLWRNIEILIIDEVSMMSKELFELLDTIGKRIRKNAKPFGGIQLIMCGDFYQLPPIGNVDNPDSKAFCFESELWNDTFDTQILLDKSFRQNEQEYIDILNNIRQGYLNKTQFNILKKHVNRPFNLSETNYIEPVRLLPIKKKVEIINNEKLKSLETNECIYDYEINFDFDVYKSDKKNIDNATLKYNKLQNKQNKKNNKKSNENNNEINDNNINKINNYFKSSTNTKDDIKNDTKEQININNTNIENDILSLIEKPQQNKIDKEAEYLLRNVIIEKQLKLKIGAQVMCTSNIDLEKGICNGSTGIVIDFKTDKLHPVVKFNNGLIWTFTEKQSFYSDNITGLSISQYPLILAWAVTIHKSQGATLSHVIIDAGSSIFAEGQTYVALSRVKSLDGLWLKSFDPQKIIVNKKVKDFYNKFYEYENEN